MIKWIKGFLTGIVLIANASAIGLMMFYIWLLKDMNEQNKKWKYRYYHRYSK